MTQTPNLPEPDDDQPTQIELLDEYLSSERAPPRCMDLSELDGFMAGIIAGPEPIMPSEWMPVIWDGDEASFDSPDEAQTIMGAILNRYNEIQTALDGDPTDYMPIFWEDDEGEPVVEDWAHGFMHAVSMRTEAWEPVLRDEETAVMLIPIGIIAGLAAPEIDPELRLPEDEMEDLLEDADMMLAACAVGLRAFWRDRPRTPTVRH